MFVLATQPATPNHPLLHRLPLPRFPLPCPSLPSDKAEETSYRTTYHPSQRSSGPSFSMLYSSSSSKVNHLSSPSETEDQSFVFWLFIYQDNLDLRSACSSLSESDKFRFDVDLEMDVGDGDAEHPMMLLHSLPFEPQRQLGNRHRHEVIQDTLS